MTSKYALIHAEEGRHEITAMCRLLTVERTGYHAWRTARSAPPETTSPAARRATLAQRITALWERSRRVYGARRIHTDLAAEGEQASLWLVGKIRGELGIAGIQPRSSTRTTIPAADAVERDDLLRRRFTPPVATTHLVGDITYLKMGEGWLFLATVIDLTTRMVVGWQTVGHMRASLITDALAMAQRSGYVAGGAVFHSDRGAQGGFNWSSRSIMVRLTSGRSVRARAIKNRTRRSARRSSRTARPCVLPRHGHCRPTRTTRTRRRAVGASTW